MVVRSHFKEVHLLQIPLQDISLVRFRFKSFPFLLLAYASSFHFFHQVSEGLFPKLKSVLPRLLQALEAVSRPDRCDDPEIRRALLSRLISARYIHFVVFHFVFFVFFHYI